jgi:predicted transcriptional regulator
MNENASSTYIDLAADIVSAYVSNNSVPAGDLPGLISQVHLALARVGNGAAEASAEAPKPAIAIKKSVTPDYIICLEDGKKFKSLKRHLRTNHSMTPQEYRAAFGLRPDYPMVAPAYASARSDLARTMGLGRKGGSSPTDAPEPMRDSPTAPEASSERKPKVAAKRASGGSRKKSAKVPVKGKAKKKKSG